MDYYDLDADLDALSYRIKDVFTSESLRQSFLGESALFPIHTTRTKDPTMNPECQNTTPAEQVAAMREQADRIEAAEAKREADRIERKRVRADLNRQHEGSLAVLENLMHNGKSEQIRLQAAQALHKATH